MAEEHGIPVFEEVRLARSMYDQVKIDQMIPAQFYQAIAELGPHHLRKDRATFAG